MKLLLKLILVYVSFSALIVHSFIPHHHHHSTEPFELGHHHDGDHGHHHHPPYFHSVDGNFVNQNSGYQLVTLVGILDGTMEYSSTVLVNKLAKVIAPPPEVDAPLPPFLKAFSLRGPPLV